MAKILQINLTANALSTGKIAEQIGDIIKESGSESYIGYGMEIYDKGVPTSSTSSSKTIIIGNKYHRFLHRLLVRIIHLDGYFSFIATKSFIRHVNQIKPDIVHLHNIFNSYLNHRVLFEYLRNEKIPVVYTIHDCRPFTGFCSHFTYKKCNKWQNQCGDCPYFVNSLMDISMMNYKNKMKYYEDINLKYVVGVSSWLSDCISHSKINSENIVTIHNGIDCDMFSYKDSNLKKKMGIDNKFIVLSVSAAWNNNKGLHDFIELSKMLDYDKYIIVLVGFGKKIQNLFPLPIITVPLTTSQAELAQFYSMADVTVSLSKAETFGLTLVESLSCGTPVIAYDNTGMSEIVVNDVGIKVKTGDLRKVKEAIEKIESKGKSYYSERCRNIAILKYNKNVNYLEYKKIYKEILKNK